MSCKEKKNGGVVLQANLMQDYLTWKRPWLYTLGHLHLYWKINSQFNMTSMACAIGPIVNPLQNRETQHVNIVLHCMYWSFEHPNMKGNHAWIEWWALKCYHLLYCFFLPKPGFLEFIWIFRGRNHFKINISHILNPNLTK
jgi:hypothetical protein